MIIKVNKLLLSLALMLSASAWAEWEPVVPTADGSSMWYLDFDTVKTDSKYVYAWTLTDYKEDKESVKAYIQLDCGIPSKYKFLSITYYEGNMGYGKIHAGDDTDWRYPQPKSVLESFTSYLCLWSKVQYK